MRDAEALPVAVIAGEALGWMTSTVTCPSPLLNRTAQVSHSYQAGSQADSDVLPAQGLPSTFDCSISYQGNCGLKRRVVHTQAAQALHYSMSSVP